MIKNKLFIPLLSLRCCIQFIFLLFDGECVMRSPRLSYIRSHVVCVKLYTSCARLHSHKCMLFSSSSLSSSPFSLILCVRISQLNTQTRTHIKSQTRTLWQAPEEMSVVVFCPYVYCTSMCCIHVCSNDEQATRFSVLSRNSIECNCRSTGRVLSYYRSFLFECHPLNSE